MIYRCCEERRRSVVADPKCPVNGIDYLEVLDREAEAEELRQRLLRVFFVKPPDAALKARFVGSDAAAVASLVRISGGARIRAIQVETVRLDGDTILVCVAQRGDFSTYTLHLVEPDSDRPLAQLDPQLAAVDFTFKIECPSDFDCRATRVCPTEPVRAPELDYLAKDYASFRQLMLDRLAVLAPGWEERSPADLGIALVELLAYVGDQLSYRQDAIGTEAYLGTARRRVSVRRHARLLDYFVDEGCNARAWIQVSLKPGVDATRDGLVLPRFVVLDPQGMVVDAPEDEPLLDPDSLNRVGYTRFVTRVSRDVVLDEATFRQHWRPPRPEVFQPLHRVTLYAEHNEMDFYTWSDEGCCLPQGAVKATLQGHYPHLQPGDVLVFAERVGPLTGNAADADPSHRHAVRLTKVNGLDGERYERTGQLPPLFDPVIATPDGRGQPVTEIEWAAGDALPFPLCIATRQATRVSFALGNIVLADHGLTLPEREPLGEVPSANPVLAPVTPVNAQGCATAERRLTPPRFQPRLTEAPLTHAAAGARLVSASGTLRQTSFDPDGTAASAFAWGREDVLPAVQLRDNQGRVWAPQRDLLSSNEFAPEFVVEIGNQGEATLRFGDDENGMRPGEGTSFQAVYRVGNGSRGNVGANAIAHLVASHALLPSTGTGWHATAELGSLIASVSNPLPARGGADPETLEQVRQRAPAAFRVQQRAVTAADYAATAELHPEVQRAVATIRWTGSWHTVFLTVDRRGGRPVDDEFETMLRAFLERYRTAGRDLEIEGPRFVTLALELEVCVRPEFFCTDVLAALTKAFSSRVRPDGSLGFFHPDNFTFGRPVLLSRIYAAAQAVDGVQYAAVTRLSRAGVKTPAVPETGILEMGRLEIARLESHPSFPDRGNVVFCLKGGR